jgi:hypothetical protein
LVLALCRGSWGWGSVGGRRAGPRAPPTPPDAGAAEAMGANLMDRRRAPEALAAGFAQGLALAE